MGHEADVFSGDQLRRDDQVAFVLTVFVIDDDDELAGLEVGDRLGNGGKAHCLTNTIGAGFRRRSGPGRRLRG